MAGGGVVLTRPSALRISEYHGRLTFFVVMVAAVAASGGLLFGYDNGCIGGVLAFPEFEQKFFPDVYAKKEQALASETSPYCTYDNATIQIFTSSFFLAGMFSSLFAAKVTRTFGRKLTMGFGSLLFIAGGLVNALAQNVAMLVVGRLLLGFGVGFVNQVVPLYLSEMAPYQYRGGLNVCFQLCITIGILVAQLVNYGVQDWDKGWRLSLGLAGAPAVILLIGAILLPESPNFLIEKGKPEQGRRVLQRLRGTTKVDAEFDDIVDAVEVGRGIRMRESWRSLLTRRYQPQLITTFLINLFQQFTGINAIIFYVPVLFSSLGTGKSAALLNTVVIGCVNVGSTLVSVVSVDKFGRKFLLIEGGIQCCLAMIATGVVLGVEFGNYAGSELPKGVAIGVLVVICVFISGFAWSWGPLGWLVPSEIYTLETRAAGTATAVFANFLFTFIIGQTFLSMLCAMRFGVFLFFAAFLVIMVLWVIFFLPETKGVPVERVSLLFAKHWFWKKWMGPAAEQVLAEAEARTASRKAAQLEGAALPTPGADYATGPPPSMISAEAPRV